MSAIKEMTWTLTEKLDNEFYTLIEDTKEEITRSRFWQEYNEAEKKEEEEAINFFLDSIDVLFWELHKLYEKEAFLKATGSFFDLLEFLCWLDDIENLAEELKCNTLFQACDDVLWVYASIN